MGTGTSLKVLLLNFWDASSKQEKEEAYNKLHSELSKLLYITLKWKFGSAISKEEIEDVLYEWIEDKIIQPNQDLIETCRSLTEGFLKKYLMRSVINSYIDKIRHKEMEDNIRHDISNASDNIEEPDLTLQQDTRKLAKIIYKKMTGRQKTILFEYFYKENPVENICKNLKVEKSTVYNEIKNIMKMIGEEAGTYEEGEAIKEELENLIKDGANSNDEPLEK